jgi:intracellular multiplication protein IcmJ
MIMAVRPLEPLVLSSKRSVWRMNDHADEADKEFQKIRRAVLDAYQNTCVYCSHQSEKFQEAHHRDDDHKNNKQSNIACACPLCHQVFHPGLAGMKEGGDLVYVPELDQATLNQLALTIWMVNKVDVAKLVGDAAVTMTRLVSKAKALMGLLDNRRGTVVLRLKEALKDPAYKFPQELLQKIKISHITPTLLSNVLMSLDEADYEKRDQLLGGIRLLPKAARFSKRIDHWSAEQAKVTPVDSWYKFIPEDQMPFLIQHVSDKIDLLTPKSA